MFPEAILGVIAFHDIRNRGENADVMMALWKEEASVIERFQTGSVQDHPHVAVWREAYRKFGAKPKDNPSSIENLVRRSIKGQAMRHINLLVDLYNTISLRYILPVGGEDLEKIQGDIELTFAGGNEPAVKLLGEPEARPPKPGEVIYKDEIGAICRRWNWKEADRTKFTEDTQHGFIVIERLPPVEPAIVNRAINELAEMIQTHCSGSVVKGTLNATNPEMSL